MKIIPVELMDILIAMAETKNLYQAADRLKVSQALVSVKLKELEQSAPLPVFAFEGRRKVLTKYGQELYLAAKLQTQNWQDSLEKLNRQYSLAQNMTLKIAGRSEILESFATKIEFAGNLKLEPTSSQLATQKLLNREVDMAITYEIPDSSEIIAKKFMDSSAQLIVHRQWVSKKKNLAYEKEFLTTTPCLLYTAKGELTQDWLKHIGISFDQIKCRIISEDWRTLFKLVEEKKGYSIVPSYIKTKINKDILSWPLPTTILPKYTFFICYHKELRKFEALKSIV